MTMSADGTVPVGVPGVGVGVGMPVGVPVAVGVPGGGPMQGPAPGVIGAGGGPGGGPMPMAAPEQVWAALCGIRSLRSSVSDVFEALTAGLRADHGEETAPPAGTATTSGAGASTTPVATTTDRPTTTTAGGAKFIGELHELVTAVSSELREVEQAVACLAAPPGPFSLGNAAHLSQEISSDRQALYSQLVHSYRWTDKVHEYAGVAHALLSQNSLKRSYSNSNSTKRRRTQTGTLNMPPHVFEEKIATLDRQFPNMKMTVSRPFAANAVVHISLGHVLKAVVAFKGLMIEWIVVKGHGESVDPWTESRHAVFRKVTEHAYAAMLHFHSPAMQEMALRSFVIWFHSFNGLFSDACKKCRCRLRNDMPPTWRDFRTLEPFHEECKG